MNKAIITGRLSAAPELKHLESGSVVANITLAVDTGFGDHRKVEWIDCTIWGKQAEIVEKYCIKGDRLGVVGEMASNTWKNRETGKKQKSWYVNVRELDLLSSKAERDRAAEDYPVIDEEDGDLPF